LAATLPCAPILARFAPTMPVGGVFANVIAVPIGESVALPLCLLHALLAPWPAAERGCASVASGALVLVRAIARSCAGARALSLDVPMPTAWQMVAIGVGFAALAARNPGSRWWAAVGAVAATLVLEVGARRDGAPKGILRATFLDVGQGDAAIVDLPNGDALLIDGGGLVGSPIDVGARVIAPAFRARRRGALAAVILSHPHPDHYGGFAAGLASTRVSTLWDTGQAEREGATGAYRDLLAWARRSDARVLRPGDLCGARNIGGARVEVLAPCPAALADRGPNDNSFVIRISLGRRALLFVGDAESEEEQDLLRLASHALRADVLKVGHHGSRTSSSAAFVAAVAPSDAVVSSGIRNRFGHPHPATLATFAASGARVWRTDRVGAIVVETDGVGLDVHAERGAR
jgi:competence protein ComEC